MPKWLNKANIYIAGWCIYNTQGVLFSKGTLFTQLLLIFLLLVSLYYCFVANFRYKLPVYFWGLNLLLSLFFVYGVYLMIGGYNPMDYITHVDSFSYLKTIMISILPIYVFYVFSKEGLLTKKSLCIWLFIFLSLTTINYFKSQQEMLMLALLNHSRTESFTNNYGYGFLALIPACVFLYKKPLIQYLVIGYIMVFMLMAMKRGALVIGIVCLIWFLWKNIKEVHSRMRFLFIAFAVFLCFVGYQFAQKQMEESLYFQKRVEDTLEGNSSGRDVLYEELANYYWNEATPLQFLFGSGANATLKVSRYYAHNDWLEIAVNQGLLGLLIYLLYWLIFTKVVFSRTYEPHIKLALQLFFIIYFMKTFFSMSYADMSIGATCVLGYCLTQEKKNEQIVYSN